jgi:uncharacterized membrane protein
VKSITLILVLIAAFARTAAASTKMLSQTVPPDNGFDPGLLFGVLLVCAVLLVLVGIGIVVALVCLACAVILAALGVVSASALVAILRRRLSAGARALHYELLALLGLPCGIGALWLGSSLFDIHIRHRYILAIGSAIGILAGIAIAFILDRFFLFVYRRYLQRPILAA